MKKVILLLLVANATFVMADRLPEQMKQGVPIGDALLSVGRNTLLEVDGKNIRVAADGTGVIKGVACSVCTSRTIKITKKSVAYHGAKVIDMAAAKKRFGNAPAVTRFNLDTNEVIYVRW